MQCVKKMTSFVIHLDLNNVIHGNLSNEFVSDDMICSCMKNGQIFSNSNGICSLIPMLVEKMAQASTRFHVTTKEMTSRHECHSTREIE